MSSKMRDVYEGADIIYSRDVDGKIAELQEERLMACGRSETEGRDGETPHPDYWSDDQEDDLKRLLKLRDDVNSPEWKHGLVLVCDNHFQEYAENLASDIGGYNPNDVSWPYTFIDWEKAAEALKQDYSGVEYGDTTYWYQG
jgi:hypothetical protein